MARSHMVLLAAAMLFGTASAQLDYPDCPGGSSQVYYINDGYCDYSYNVASCGWDGGDCCESTCVASDYYCSYFDCKDVDATDSWPDCTGSIRSYLGDDICDGGDYNTYDCGWDGGDCCWSTNSNAAAGDCLDPYGFDEPAYPDCPYSETYLADGYCDGSYYNIADCGWDGGDCCNSTCVTDTYTCSGDSTSCLDPTSSDYNPLGNLPNCVVDMETYVGDGYCDDAPYNTANCGWDGGDCCESTCAEAAQHGCVTDFACMDPYASDYDQFAMYPGCTAYSATYLGDGDCDGGSYNVASCGWDGGDCCNSTCVPATYDCSADDFICLNPSASDYNPTANFPDCYVSSPTFLGDGDCDGGSYNVESCGWDAGDCCNSTCVPSTYSCSADDFVCLNPLASDYNPFGLYPGCTAPLASYLGDAYCDGSVYNVAACGWDGGDCCESTCDSGSVGVPCSTTFSCSDPWASDFNPMYGYPSCDVSYITWIGDGYCDGSSYNVAACGWDGGDCCNSTCVATPYYDCTAVFDCRNPWASDAYPLCDAPTKSYIGDGYCDGDDYNTVGCSWDGGDCCDMTCVTSTFDCPSDLYDCKDPWAIAYSCTADASLVGDGVCQTAGGADSPNTFACGWDGGDCCLDTCSLASACVVNVATNDFTQCSDPFSSDFIFGGCTADIWSYLGDGYCDGGDYNVANCGWDGGDCCPATCVDTWIYNCGDGDFDCQDPSPALGSLYSLQFDFTASTTPSVAAIQTAVENILGLSSDDIYSINIRVISSTDSSSRRNLATTVTYRVTVILNYRDNMNLQGAATLIQRNLGSELEDDSISVGDASVVDNSGTTVTAANGEPVNVVGIAVGVVVAVLVVAGVVVAVVVVMGKRGKSVETNKQDVHGKAETSDRAAAYETNKGSDGQASGTAAI